MEKYFKYDDEYISGWTYFLRSILNSLLSLLLIGLYLNSVTAYKRARSLGHNDTATLWGIWGFLTFPLAFTPLALITNTIPHWYLWFSNGRGETLLDKEIKKEAKENILVQQEYSDSSGVSVEDLQNKLIDKEQEESIIPKKAIKNNSVKNKDKNTTIEKPSKKPKNSKTTENITLYHDNGILRTKAKIDSNGKPHGRCKEWYSNGNIHKDHNYKNGVPHGSMKTYFDNGNLWQEYNFKSGEQHGKNIEYYEDGSVSIYHNFKDGKLHGLQEQYYPSGNLETRTTYENGLIEGVHIYLSEDGDVIEEKIMKKGLDITMELMAFMMENEGEHMIKAGIIKDGPQELENGEISQKMYEYYKINNISVDSAQVASLKKLLKDGKIDKDFYDFSMSGLGQNDIDVDKLIKKMSKKNTKLK